MNWMIATIALSVSAVCAALWVWMTQHLRTKNQVNVPVGPNGEEFGLIAYRQGAVPATITVRREGFFGSRVGGEWIGLIAASEDLSGDYEVYWSATKLGYKTQDDLKKLRPSNPDHHAVCADIDEALKEVVLAEQNHVRNLNRLHEAQRRLRGHS